MDQRTNDRNQMFWAVLTVLLKNKLIWQAVPVIVIMVDEFQAMLDNIAETARIAGVTLTGITNDKNVKMRALRTMLFNMMAPLSTFAKRTKNFELLAEVKLPEYKIKKLRQNDAVRLAAKVISFLKAHKVVLVEYGITADKITALELATTQVSDALPAPTVSVSERKAANEKLHLLMSQTDAFLNEEMDGMMVSFRETNDNFFNSYINSKNVIEHGIRHEKKDDNTDVNNKESTKPTSLS